MTAQKLAAVGAPSTCPSSVAEVGSQLIGVVGPEGRVAFLGTPLPVTESFLEVARQGRKPEQRFRFAGPCHEGRCSQWTGTRCGVADTVVEALETDLEAALRPCLIREACRWWQQQGRAACSVCEQVVTDLTEEAGLPGAQATL